MEVDIIALVSETLEPLNIMVIEGWYDNELNKTHITVHEYLESEESFQDDEASELEHNIQVDIWSKDSVEAYNLKKQVRKLLKENGFKFTSGQDLFESDTKIYHKGLRFTYLEEM
ncbi:hypothetical protein P5E70_04430 [Clostridium perfringens]|uniref:tail completion protein gp17 n=1 Tax=Clostridium perfringens TaxID=1502 RepID=UPI002A313034|nr:hypothetical protein [Clostridium perfringens]MDM0756167.1 hypothetical protein [Clostridium perfringens]MDM0759085.1 hypothetical protein [Clostridium perfringens]